MIFTEEPGGFDPRFTIVSCFCEHGGEIILLHRKQGKSQGLKWGVPAGKAERNESLEDAIAREMKEETGIELESSKINYFGKVYVRYSDYDFLYHIFYTALPEKAGIKINTSEHLDSAWVTPEEALRMPLVQDLDACIRLFYGM